MKVQTGVWPDYVFDKGYTLSPLSHVEAYINEHHHLPKVSSAIELREDGVDVGQTQVMLLEKIEELTLYLIDQNKKLELQQKELEELKALVKDRTQL